MTAVKGDVLDTAGVAATVKGHDAVIAAVNDPPADLQFYVRAAHSLIDGLTQAGVKRLIVVGGAGSLEVAPGLKLYDTPEFPELWRPGQRRSARRLMSIAPAQPTSTGHSSAPPG